MHQFITSLTKHTLEAKVGRAWENWERRRKELLDGDNSRPPGTITGGNIFRKAKDTEESRVSQMVWNKVKDMCENGDILLEIRLILQEEHHSKARERFVMIYVRSCFRWASRVRGMGEVNLLSGSPSLLLNQFIDCDRVKTPDDVSREPTQVERRNKAQRILVALRDNALYARKNKRDFDEHSTRKVSPKRGERTMSSGTRRVSIREDARSGNGCETRYTELGSGRMGR